MKRGIFFFSNIDFDSEVRYVDMKEYLGFYFNVKNILF